MLVEILSTAAQMYEKSQRLEAGEWPWLKVIRISAIRYFLLFVGTNKVTVVHSFRDITTFTVYLSVCDLEKSSNVDKIVENLKLQTTCAFWFLRKHNS